MANLTKQIKTKQEKEGIYPLFLLNRNGLHHRAFASANALHTTKLCYIAQIVTQQAEHSGAQQGTPKGDVTKQRCKQKVTKKLLKT